MIVVTSKFVIANDMGQEVHQAFLNRPHKVDGVEGFIRMEVLRNSDNDKEFMLITYWTDKHSYEVWHKSHQYSDAHSGIPKGLKLEKRSVVISKWQQISD